MMLTQKEKETIKEEIRKQTLEEVKEPFLKPKIHKRILLGGKVKLKEPLLELMTNSGESITYEGVKPGPLIYKDGKTIKTINLDAGKLFNWRYGGETYKKWYCYEDEATPYPHEVQHDSRRLRLLMDALRLSFENKDIRKFNREVMIKWLTYIAIGAGILWFIFFSPFGQQIIGQISGGIGGAVDNIAPKAIIP